MPTGKGRKPAPPGYMTPARASELLGSRSNVYKLAEAGRLHKHIPPGKSHGYYSISEVQAIIEADRAFFEEYRPGDYRKHSTSTFERAAEDDMPTIVEIDRQIFGEPAAEVETSLSWFRKNPDAFYVLRDETGIIVGYASALPLRREMIDQFIRDEIEGECITPDDIQEYKPNKAYHLYIMSIGIGPQYSTQQRHSYGARLITGLFAFLFDLASRGIEIETITARSYKPDGLRLLRKLGFPQMRSPVQGKSLFAIRVPESGAPFLVKYCELLDQWKQEHEISKPKRTRKKTTEEPTPLPDQTLWSNL